MVVGIPTSQKFPWVLAVKSIMKGQTSEKILRSRLQRDLRKLPTTAEHRLWQHLRGRQIEGCKFRRQHPYSDYILDFVCLERYLIVELDGSQHFGALDYDSTRTPALEAAGFGVQRFWNNDVMSDLNGVLEAIRQSLITRGTPSPPNPPPEGEG